MSQRASRMSLMCLGLALAFVLAGCEPPKATPVKTVTIPDGEIDPAVWGKAYPEEYELWKKTAEPVATRRSKYKTGMDGGAIEVDKLSEFPYMALLFNGWGFGVEYNEPRGHAYMIRDQLEIDASRIGAGGVCLSCKSPYAAGLQKEMGENYYKMPFKEVLAKIPEKNRELGVACIDCHDNKDMSLKISRGFTLIEAYKAMGVDPAKLTRQRNALGRLRPVPRDLQHPQGQGQQVGRALLPVAEQQVGQHHDRGHHPADPQGRNRPGVEADGHRLQDGLHPPPGVRVLDQRQHPLQGRGLLRRLPHALHRGRRAQGLGPPGHEPDPGRHEGLQAVPRRGHRLAARAGLRHPGPHRVAS